MRSCITTNSCFRTTSALIHKVSATTKQAPSGNAHSLHCHSRRVPEACQMCHSNTMKNSKQLYAHQNLDTPVRQQPSASSHITGKCELSTFMNAPNNTDIHCFVHSITNCKPLHKHCTWYQSLTKVTPCTPQVDTHPVLHRPRRH